jgi:probable rRNA maturation factor
MTNLPNQQTKKQIRGDPMIEIQNNYPKAPKINTSLLKKAIILTLNQLEKSELDITLRLTDDSEMRQLNQEFRCLDKSTDVLAFNQDTIDPETNRLYLGDIIISVNRASQQSQEQGHSIDHEAAILAIHGTLHLLGYDHDSPEDKRKMWAMQKEIFQHLTNTIGGKSE